MGDGAVGSLNASTCDGAPLVRYHEIQAETHVPILRIGSPHPRTPCSDDDHPGGALLQRSHHGSGLLTLLFPTLDR